MQKPTIYLDTSVLGGCFDAEFAPWSKGLMKDIRLGHYRPVLSELIATELENAPEKIRDIYAALIDERAEILCITDEVLDLVQAYGRHKILGLKFKNDMMHIALATVRGVDLLVSWNFKHIVHFDKIRQFNAVNVAMGYKMVAIYSPREVTNYGQENSDD